MTTVSELIELLQTLPPETLVKVAVCESDGYTKFQDLDIPTVAEGLNPADYSDNMDFLGSMGDDDEPWIYFGRT